MTRGEAVNWIINISADIGKAEHRELWHYEQALCEIREMLEYVQPEYYDYSDIDDIWEYYAEEQDINLTDGAKQIKDAMWVGYRKGKQDAQPELNEWCYDCKEYDKDRHCCPRFNRVIRQTVEEVKAEQRWIPCSERLPKKNGEYLVTEIDSLTRDCLIDIAHYGDWIQENSGFHKANEVIAWMPLPEPYAERRTNESVQAEV